MFTHLDPVLSTVVDFLAIPDLYQIAREEHLLPEGLSEGYT